MAVMLMLSCASQAIVAQATIRYGESRYASLYDDSTVGYWRGRYAPNLRVNFDTLLAHLSAGERDAVNRNTLRISTRDPADPFAFYARRSPPSIHLSALSIKFLDDIAIAAAWLAENKYSLETIAYYNAVLKYRQPDRFAGGRYPPPLTTLGIPDDALANPLVDDASQKTLKGAIMFVMAHEIGHVVHRDAPTGTAEERQRREAAADAFAIDMFRRMGTAPAGLETLMLVATFMDSTRGDFATDAAWRTYVAKRASHPLTGRRVAALANALRVRPQDFTRTEKNPTASLVTLRYMATELAGLGPLLDDTDLHRHTTIVGRWIPLSELRPRRPGHSWMPGSSR